MKEHARLEPKSNGKPGWVLFGESKNFMFIDSPGEMWRICQVLADKLDELNGYTNGA